MAERLIKKRKAGREYWYLVKSARVDGKPRIVKQRYLGPVDRVAELFDQAREPIEVKRSFAGPLALWALADRLGIAETIDQVVPKRTQGIGVGEAIQLIAVNRADRPCSKRSVAEWYSQTSLQRTLRFKPKQLASQRLWDVMDRLSAKQIEACEHEIAKRLVGEFGVSVELLCFDPTNFYTYIDTDTPSELARRGHSKERRHDLRQVSLALLVSRDHQLPLLHQTYPGNAADAPTLKGLTERLEKRAGALGAKELTMVFDKGCWSADLAARLEQGPYRFVAALKLANYPALAAVARDRYRKLDGISGTSAYRAQVEVSGTERTVVACFSEQFYRKQRRGFAQTLARAQGQLQQVKETLELGRTRRTRKELELKVAETLKPRWLKRVLKVELAGPEGALKLVYKTDDSELDRLEDEVFGKTLLVTDRSDWTDEEIVSAYRSQNQAEQSFKALKDPEFLATRPIFHWTDQKIRVHIFCCVLGLILTNLIWRQAAAMNIEASPKKLLKGLRELTEVELIYAPLGGGAGRPRVVRKLATPSKLGRTLVESLDFSGEITL